MHDYWIGDRVWIASIREEGIFEGERDGLALVRIRTEKRLVPFSDISLLPETEEVFVLPDEDTSHGRSRRAPVPDTIDLHIDILNPALVHAEPALILTHQCNRLKDFLQKAIRHGLREVVIIHGKGEGVLRNEVLEILHEFKPIRQIEDASHGGAVRVRF